MADLSFQSSLSAEAVRFFFALAGSEMLQCSSHESRGRVSGPLSRKWPRRFFLRGSWQPLPYSIGQPYPMQEIDESRVVAQRIEPWINVEIRHPT